MEYRTLGRSGTAVSTYALGTMTFGAESDEATAHEQLDLFLAAGGNLVDTADVYAGTESESIIGRWLTSRGADVRDQVVLATKGRFPTAGHPNGLGLSRKHLASALDASLRRLQVEAIDLYQVHAWDAHTPLEETVSFFDDAVAAGKVRYWGLSNYTGWQLTKTVALAEHHGWPVPVTLQPQYNLLVRGIEAEIVPAVQDAGMGLLPWSPLAGGWLTGKYQRDNAPSGATRLGGEPQPGHGGLRGPQRPGAHLGGARRRHRDRRPARRVPGAGVAGLAGRTSGGQLGHPRRPHHRAAAAVPGSGGRGARA